jgi:CRISPR-associated protein Csa3
MQTYLSTLGFHETRVTRPVIKHGVNAGDRIILVRPANDGNVERAADAVSYVEDMIEEIEPSASVTVEQVNTSEFMTTVLQCSDLLAAVDQDRELIVNFGGGAREVLLPLLIATILHAPVVDQAFQYTDVEQEVENIRIPNLSAQIPANALDTFELVVRLDGDIALPELATESTKSKSSVSRHVDSLAEVGVLETRMEQNTKYIMLSQTGILLARSHSLDGQSPS